MKFFRHRFDGTRFENHSMWTARHGGRSALAIIIQFNVLVLPERRTRRHRIDDYQARDYIMGESLLSPTHKSPPQHLPI